MTIHTGIVDNGVDILHCLQLGFIVVTTVTEVVAGCDELVFAVAGMNIVTGLAVVQRWRMLDLLRRLGLVTLGTEWCAALGQQALLRRGVRGVATQTIPLFDRRMDRTLPLALAVMTLVTKSGRRCSQQPLQARSVRRVTGSAVALGHRRVDNGKSLSFTILALIVVALLTQCRPHGYRQLRRFAGVGIVTTETIALPYRRMNNLGIFHQTIVALLAERRTGGQEELRIITGVRRVTGSTPFVSDDRMDTLHPLGRVVVTTGTKVTAAGDQEFTIFAQVRIMTIRAAIFEGRMDQLLPLAHAVMALLAKSGAAGGELESPLFTGVRDAAGFVAGRTITTSHRIVQLHPFRRAHRRVTFTSHTALSGGQGERRHNQQADPE